MLRTPILQLMTRPLRFGIRFNSDSGAIRDVVRWAVLAESLGFDNFWYCHDLMKRDAWVTLTAVAAATSRIRVGTCIVNPFTSSPAEIAMHAASLQEYSEGRFVLGIGPGDPPYRSGSGWSNAIRGAGWPKPYRNPARAVSRRRSQHRGRSLSLARRAHAHADSGAAHPDLYGRAGAARARTDGRDGRWRVADHVSARDDRRRWLRTSRPGRRAPAARSTGFDLAACVWWSMAETRAEAEDALRYLIAYYGPSLRAGDAGARSGWLRPTSNTSAQPGRAMTWREPCGLSPRQMFQLAIVGTADEMLARVRWLQRRGRDADQHRPATGPQSRVRAAQDSRAGDSRI